MEAESMEIEALINKPILFPWNSPSLLALIPPTSFPIVLTGTQKNKFCKSDFFALATYRNNFY